MVLGRHGGSSKELRDHSDLEVRASIPQAFSK